MQNNVVPKMYVYEETHALVPCGLISLTMRNGIRPRPNTKAMHRKLMPTMPRMLLIVLGDV